MWWGGGPCDFSVSPSPFGLDFGTLDFGTSDTGLTTRALAAVATEGFALFALSHVYSNVGFKMFVSAWTRDSVKCSPARSKDLHFPS